MEKRIPIMKRKKEGTQEIYLSQIIVFKKLLTGGCSINPKRKNINLPAKITRRKLKNRQRVTITNNQQETQKKVSENNKNIALTVVFPLGIVFNVDIMF